MYRALRLLATALAPICCFTAEEVWSHMPHLPGDPDSVHLALLDAGKTAPASALMASLLELRAVVQMELEAFRAQKKSSLDADVEVHVLRSLAPELEKIGGGWLADFLIVSHVSIHAADKPHVVIKPATGNRCERCWKWTPEPPPLCARCKAAVAARGAA